MKYLVWCINVTSKQLSFPRDSNIRSKNPIPISNDSQCLHLHKKFQQVTLPVFLLCSGLHDFIWNDAAVCASQGRRRYRDLDQVSSPIFPRATKSSPAPHVFKPLRAPSRKLLKGSPREKKAKLWENPTLISWGSFLASQSKGYDPSHHPINDANSLRLSVLWDSSTSDFIIFLDQYYQSYSCTPPSPM